MPSPHKNLRQNRESRFRASTGVKNCLTRQLSPCGRRKATPLRSFTFPKTFPDGRTSPYSEPKMLQNTSHALFIKVWITFTSGIFTCRFIHIPKRHTLISTNKKLLISHHTQQETIAALLGARLLDHVTACVIIESSGQILCWTCNSKCSFLLIEHSAQGLIVHRAW